MTELNPYQAPQTTSPREVAASNKSPPSSLGESLQAIMTAFFVQIFTAELFTLQLHALFGAKQPASPWAWGYLLLLLGSYILAIAAILQIMANLRSLVLLLIQLLIFAACVAIFCFAG